MVILFGFPCQKSQLKSPPLTKQLFHFFPQRNNYNLSVSSNSMHGCKAVLYDKNKSFKQNLLPIQDRVTATITSMGVKS